MPRFPINSLGEVTYDSGVAGVSEVLVIVPLYNYEHTVAEALESIVAQDLQPIAVVVIDDCSTDDGGSVAAEFLHRHASRFAGARVVRHKRNQGLAMARNSGIAWSSERFLFMLDADNRIRPPALSRLLGALHCSGSAFAYSQLRLFGDEDGIGCADVWDPSRLSIGNYIDAMALIRREALLAAGGYHPSAVEDGWEDHDLWCRFAELGLEGVFLPELLCEYRMHAASMLRTRTNHRAEALTAEMALRHPTIFRAE
jgi:glycosyltransferase involved in cell wall biosynthesis